MSVELWAARIECPLTAEEMDALAGLLPAFRRERMEKLRREDKRQEVLIAYLLLRCVLQEHFGQSDWPEFAFRNGGKPYFPGEPEVQFSLSHTDGAVAVAVSGLAVGVDIEKIRPLRRTTVCSFPELYTQEDFFRSWVRKEALAKCRGSGVAGMLRTEPQLQSGEHYLEQNVFSGYVAGVAFCEDAADVTVRIISQKELIKRG